MTSISKNVYTDILNNIVIEYNNIDRRTIKMEPVDFKDNTYIDFNKEVVNKDPKFKVVDHVRISRYKNSFAKDILHIGLKKFLSLKMLETLFHGHILLMTLMVKKSLEHFMKNNLKKQIKKNLG